MLWFMLRCDCSLRAKIRLRNLINCSSGFITQKVIRRPCTPLLMVLVRHHRYIRRTDFTFSINELHVRHVHSLSWLYAPPVPSQSSYPQTCPKCCMDASLERCINCGHLDCIFYSHLHDSLCTMQMVALLGNHFLIPWYHTQSLVTFMLTDVFDVCDSKEKNRKPLF